MNSNGYAKPHMLGALNNLFINSHQIGSLQRLKSKIVNFKIAIIINKIIKKIFIFLYNSPYICVYNRNVFIVNIFELVKKLHRVGKRSQSIFMIIRHDNSVGQTSIIRMLRAHRGTLLSRKLVNFCSRYIRI